jgi:hypothetical protein
MSFRVLMTGIKSNFSLFLVGYRGTLYFEHGINKRTKMTRIPFRSNSRSSHFARPEQAVRELAVILLHFPTSNFNDKTLISSVQFRSFRPMKMEVAISRKISKHVAAKPLILSLIRCSRTETDAVQVATTTAAPMDDFLQLLCR